MTVPLTYTETTFSYSDWVSVQLVMRYRQRVHGWILKQLFKTLLNQSICFQTFFLALA